MSTRFQRGGGLEQKGRGSPLTRDEAFVFLDRLARGIAEMFGSSCETMVHDMSQPR